MKYVLVLLLTMLACRYSMGQTSVSEIENLLHENKFNEAIHLLDEVIKKDSTSEPYIQLRANAWDSLRDYSKVIENYTKLILLNPQNSNYHYLRGKAHYKIQKYDIALTDLNQCLTLKSDIWDAYFIRGEIYMLIKKDYKLAKENFSAYINAEIFTRKSDAYLYRGKIWEQESKPDNALSDFNMAIQHNSLNKEAYLARGILKINNNDDGCPDLQKYFKLKGKDAQLYVEKYCL